MTAGRLKPPVLEVEATLALAHALRTPLTSLALGLGLLDDGTLGPLSEAQRDVVRALVADLSRLSLLVDRALQTDRLGAYAGPIERVSVDLGALVREACAPILEQAREKGVEVVQGLTAGIAVVADPVKLSWVVACLLGNALRYSPSGGAIKVRLGSRGSGSGAHGADPPAPAQAELRIADQGPGVPPDAVSRIFDRDLGRGLYLAREIVEAHGGSIRVRSVPGRGSVFVVTLPVAPGADTPGRSDAQGG